MIDKFYINWEPISDKIDCFDINNNKINSPVKESLLRKGIKEGLFGFVKNKNGNWKIVEKHLIDAPWAGDNTDWVIYEINKHGDTLGYRNPKSIDWERVNKETGYKYEIN